VVLKFRIGINFIILIKPEMGVVIIVKLSEFRQTVDGRASSLQFMFWLKQDLISHMKTLS